MQNHFVLFLSILDLNHDCWLLGSFCRNLPCKTTHTHHISLFNVSWRMAVPHSLRPQLWKHLPTSVCQSTTPSQNFCSQNGRRHCVATSSALHPLYTFLTLSTECNCSNNWDILNPSELCKCLSQRQVSFICGVQNCPPSVLDLYKKPGEKKDWKIFNLTKVRPI